MLKSPAIGSATETEVLLVNSRAWLKRIREVQKRSRMLVCCQPSPKSRLLRSAKCDKVQRVAKCCWLACFWTSQSSVARSPKGAWMGVDGSVVLCHPLCYPPYYLGKASLRTADIMHMYTQSVAENRAQPDIIKTHTTVSPNNVMMG